MTKILVYQYQHFIIFQCNKKDLRKKLLKSFRSIGSVEARAFNVIPPLASRFILYNINYNYKYIKNPKDNYIRTGCSVSFLQNWMYLSSTDSDLIARYNNGMDNISKQFILSRYVSTRLYINIYYPQLKKCKYKNT